MGRIVPSSISHHVEATSLQTQRVLCALLALIAGTATTTSLACDTGDLVTASLDGVAHAGRNSAQGVTDTLASCADSVANGISNTTEGRAYCLANAT
jgi:hypothetical protein